MIKFLILISGILGFELASAQMTFIHPGGNESMEELNFVKEKIQSGAQPWTSKWIDLKNGWAKAGSASIPTTENGQRDQAKRAYANSLAYWYTGSTIYADQAISILKAWSNVTPYANTSTQSMLDGAWMGSLLGPAAELIRSYMTSADLIQVTNMFKTVFYPSLYVPSTWNGNVELTQIDAGLNIAVFCEDKAFFDYQLQRFAIRLPAYVYLKSDGSSATSLPGASWYSPNFPSPNADGLMQETCRDFNHHTQFALSAIMSSAEVAWHQGLDLYGQNKTRLIAGMELLAKEMNTGDMQNVCTNGNITTTDVYNTFEIGYNHFHNRLGYKLDETEKVLPKIQNGMCDWNIFYETLTHNGVSSRIINSVSGEWFEQGVKIYPNPATDKITVELPENNYSSVLICDLVGKPLIHRGLGNGKNEIDLSNASKGIYIISLLGAIGAVQQRLIKK